MKLKKLMFAMSAPARFVRCRVGDWINKSRSLTADKIRRWRLRGLI